MSDEFVLQKWRIEGKYHKDLKIEEENEKKSNFLELNAFRCITDSFQNILDEEKHDSCYKNHSSRSSFAVAIL